MTIDHTKSWSRQRAAMKKAMSETPTLGKPKVERVQVSLRFQRIVSIGVGLFYISCALLIVLMVVSKLCR